MCIRSPDGGDGGSALLTHMWTDQIAFWAGLVSETGPGPGRLGQPHIGEAAIVVPRVVGDETAADQRHRRMGIQR